MAQQQERSRNFKKPPRKLPESQSKFDRWLERQVEACKAISFVFQVDPISLVKGCHHYDCTVIEVDRYMVLLEFPNGECWWTNKANILSAGLPV